MAIACFARRECRRFSKKHVGIIVGAAYGQAPLRKTYFGWRVMASRRKFQRNPLYFIYTVLCLDVFKTFKLGHHINTCQAAKEYHQRMDQEEKDTTVLFGFKGGLCNAPISHLISC